MSKERPRIWAKTQENTVPVLPIIWSFVDRLLLRPQSGIFLISLQGQVITEALQQWFADGLDVEGGEASKLAPGVA